MSVHEHVVHLNMSLHQWAWAQQTEETAIKSQCVCVRESVWVGWVIGEGGSVSMCEGEMQIERSMVKLESYVILFSHSHHSITAHQEPAAENKQAAT